MDAAVSRVADSLEHLAQLNARYRAGEMRAHVPEALRDRDRSLEDLVAEHLTASHAALDAASRSLFFSLPVAFNPAESVGPYLAVVDRDAAGQPYRFLDMGALIATQAFGENDPAVVAGRPRIAAIRHLALRALRIPDRLVAAPQGRAEPHRARRHAASLHRQHRRRSGRERDQVRAHEPRDDVARWRRRLHRVVRRRLSRPHARRPRRDAPQEGAAGLPDVRLAAHSVSGRARQFAQGDGAARGAQPETTVGSAGLRPDAEGREEQGHVPARDRRARRVPRAAGPGCERVRGGATRDT